MSPYVLLAKETVETFVKEGRIIEPSANLPSDLLEKKAGVFVTIKENGALRGCIGTYMPTKGSIAEEIVSNAVAACSKDYRLKPVKENELHLLAYSIYILEEPERIHNISELKPQRCGILVKCGQKSGLLLPGLGGIETAEKQFLLACKKAGISPGENDIRIFKFRAKKYE